MKEISDSETDRTAKALGLTKEKWDLWMDITEALRDLRMVTGETHEIAMGMHGGWDDSALYEASQRFRQPRIEALAKHTQKYIDLFITEVLGEKIGE